MIYWGGTSGRGELLPGRKLNLDTFLYVNHIFKNGLSKPTIFDSWSSCIRELSGGTTIPKAVLRRRFPMTYLGYLGYIKSVPSGKHAKNY